MQSNENILETSNLLNEFKANLNQFVYDCQQYKLPGDCIAEALELIICVDGQEVHADEVSNLLLKGLPELFHYPKAMNFFNVTTTLFAKQNIPSYIDDELLLTMKETILREIYKLENMTKPAAETFGQSELENCIETLQQINFKN